MLENEAVDPCCESGNKGVIEEMRRQNTQSDSWEKILLCEEQSMLGIHQFVAYFLKVCMYVFANRSFRLQVVLAFWMSVQRTAAAGENLHEGRDQYMFFLCK